MIKVLIEGKPIKYKMYADEYLVKQIIQEELVGTVNKVLSRTKKLNYNIGLVIINGY